MSIHRAFRISPPAFAPPSHRIASTIVVVIVRCILGRFLTCHLTIKCRLIAITSRKLLNNGTMTTSFAPKNPPNDDGVSNVSEDESSFRTGTTPSPLSSPTPQPPERRQTPAPETKQKQKPRQSKFREDLPSQGAAATTAPADKDGVPLRRTNTTSPDGNRRPGEPSTRASAGTPTVTTPQGARTDKKRSHPQGRQQRSPEYGCPSCSGCVSCWTGFWDWDGWKVMRRYSAIAVGILGAVMIAAIGATGLAFHSWWWFCTLNGVDLGGVGYCEG